MTAKRVLNTIVRLLFFVTLALILLVCGTVSLLYSPWTQNKVCTAVNNHFASATDGSSLTLQSFRLRFPLKVEADGLLLRQASDTLIAARSISADVSPLPLLAGKVRIVSAEITDARYKMGSPDSAMFLTIAADTLAIHPVSVKLATMDISLDRGRISGGRLGLFMNPDTSSVTTPPAEPTRMSINIGEIALDDFTYTMRMMPTIDTLTASIPSAALSNGKIDLFNQNIHLGTFKGTGLDARYITPDSAAIAAAGPYPTPAAADTTTSAPWVISIDSIGFDKSRALYAMSGVEPLPGLDFSYIEASEVSLGLHDFYNRMTTVKLPLYISATERCGVKLRASGLIDIDAAGMSFRDFTLNTEKGTQAKFNGLLGSGDLMTDPSLPLGLNLDGSFVPADLSMMFPAFLPYFATIPDENPIIVNTVVSGTSGDINIANFDLSLNNCVKINAEGNIQNMMSPDDMSGHINITGNIINVNALKNVALDPATAKTIKIPPMTLTGNIDMDAGAINGRIAAHTKGGNIRLNGRWNSKYEKYNAQLSANTFPVDAFMPLLGIGAVTATVKVDGQGYNPFVKKTKADASLYLNEALYGGTHYSDISGNLHLAEGVASIDLGSNNPNLDFSLTAGGNLDGKVYSWEASLDGRNIDLQALKLMDNPANIEINASASAEIGPGKNDVRGHLVISDLFFRQLKGTMALSDIDMHLNANDSLTDFDLTNRDLTARFTSESSLDSLAIRFGNASEIMSGQISAFALNIDTICSALPDFAFDLVAGQSNLINDILAPSKMSVRHLSLNAINDSTLTMNANVRRLATETMRLDSIYLSAHQHRDHLHLNAGLENKPGNMDAWHSVALDGVLNNDNLSLILTQKNQKGDIGFDIGLAAKAVPADTTLSLSIRPYSPTIGYQKWKVNSDNFISYRIPDKHIDANLRMEGGNSSLAIYTEHQQGEEGHDHDQEDLVIKLTDIHISDWISFNPFAPPMKGDINADMILNTRDNMLIGKGKAGITNFVYGKEKAADFEAAFDVSAGANGLLHANADLFVNGVRTITASGVLNDSTAVSPMGLDLRVIHFPLDAANPFLPDGMAKLSGTLNGRMDVNGTSDKPIANGKLAFDSTAIYLKMTGTSYSFSPDSIDIKNSIIDLKDFKITACNNNPLIINGNVDVRNMSNMKFDIGMKAENMQIVNSNRLPHGASMFGKGYISLDARAHGSMAFMTVNADLKLLSGTNVTYVLPDAEAAISNMSHADVVKFVNFEDSTAVVLADSIARRSMAMFLDAKLTIEDGTTITVDLAPTGNNKVQIQSNGTMTYSMTPLSAGRLVGRLNIDQGFVRYAVPILGEKTFNFQNDSYISFTGNMMNPNLNINAYDIVKTNVTLEGQNSRMVNFNVTLGVTGTLEHMNVAFGLSTLDDISIANELSAMTPQQRASQAMNLLLYGMYMGPGSQRSSGIAPTGALFSFLESSINNWAANTIKGVDLSFGIDQYDKTVNGSTSSAMTYSYQVSKSLFNDRFKIIVGGNYSTDNTDENFSQNLINDISFEYFLNAARTMYIRLFRHTGYESILEGEITQTGVGFVYRRKLRRLGDMFLPPSIVKRRQDKQNEKEAQELNQHHEKK